MGKRSGGGGRGGGGKASIKNPGGKATIKREATYDGHQILLVGNDDKYNLVVYQSQTGKYRGQRLEGKYGEERWSVYRNPGEGYRDSVTPLAIRGIQPYATFGTRREAVNFARDSLSLARGLDNTGKPLVSNASRNILIDKYNLGK